MWWGYPNLSGMGMRFILSSPLGMGRVTSKYMRESYMGTGKVKLVLIAIPPRVPSTLLKNFKLKKLFYTKVKCYNF